MSFTGETTASDQSATLRGFPVPAKTRLSVLAVGGESKSAICLYRSRHAFLVGSLGNLRDPRNYRQFVGTIHKVCRRIRFKPDVIAHDRHPLYLSTKYALEAGIPAVAVQHHHAHVMSVAAELKIDWPVIGICCDGLGYGADGTAWGCEVLRADSSSFVRYASLAQFPLIGGDLSAIETWRSAAALLHQAFGTRWRREFDGLVRNRNLAAVHPAGADLDLADHLLNCGLVTMTSSLGRLFDGVSFILGVADSNSTEGQAARALESAATTGSVAPYPYKQVVDGPMVRADVVPMIREIVQDCRRGVSRANIASRFHETMIKMLADLAEGVAVRLGLRCAVLSGGCFMNERLRRRLALTLRDRRIQVGLPRDVSLGDEGLPLGQALIASAIQERALNEAGSNAPRKGGPDHVPCCAG